jgi:hypothetical protein
MRLYIYLGILPYHFFNQIHFLSNFTHLIMVSFHKILIASLALVAPIATQATPAQVVDNINSLTRKSQALQAPAQSISIINGPLILIGQGPFPQIIVGFTDIVSTATSAIASMQGMPSVPAGAQSDAIFNAFREVSCMIMLEALLTHIVCSCTPSTIEHFNRQSGLVSDSSIYWSASGDCT